MIWSGQGLVDTLPVDPSCHIAQNGHPRLPCNDCRPMVLLTLSISYQIVHDPITIAIHTPPAVGQTPKNSANEAARHRFPIPAVKSPQSTEVGPPDGRASDSEAARAVQELRIAKAIPSIASGLKWRFSSDSWPVICARWSASEVEVGCEWPAVLEELEEGAEVRRTMVRWGQGW